MSNLKSSLSVMCCFCVGIVSRTASSAQTPTLGTPEIIELSADMGIDKCISSNPPNEGTCDTTASSGDNISVILTNCAQSGDSTSCVGTWNQVKQRDGHSFSASVEIIKTTIKDSAAYTMRATVGPVSETIVPCYLVTGLSSAGTVLSSVILGGSELAISSGIAQMTYYHPVLFVGPKAQVQK